MKVSDHAKHTEELFGIRAEDIHKWIDGFFDRESFDDFVRTGRAPDTDLYDHRQFRHCIEALEEAYKEFEGKYTREQIKNVFETHIKDDYDGYLPHRRDFIDGKFSGKYHKKIHSHREHEAEEKILTQTELSEYFKGHARNNGAAAATKTSSNFHLGILIPTIIAIILFITSIFTLILPVFHENLLNQKKETIKELTASAISVVNHHINLVKSGKLSLDNARKKAFNIIREMRYGPENKDYFWITDMHPTMIIHPYRTDLEGGDLSNYVDTKDPSGKRLFVDFVKLVKKNGEGYQQYQWQWKDDSSKAAPKLSYVRGIPEWNLILGTGIYINDVEEEIAELRIELLIVFSIISIVLLLILTNIIIESHKIEQKRKKAEIGLIEAKDRYRALVESSTEGYIMEIGGEIIYSNHILQRMLGYSDDEIASSLSWDKLFTKNKLNKEVINHLDKLFKNQTAPGQFDAQIFSKSGQKIDVIIKTSRIFFTDKNGHVVSFRPVVGRRFEGLNDLDIITDTHQKVYSSITDEINSSKNAGHIIEALNRMPLLVRDMLEHGTDAEHLRMAIGTAYDAAIENFITFSLEELGPPPVNFSFMSLGSNARHEMTIYSDQDNALVFEDVEESKLNETRRYFLNLGNRVCKKLDQAGIPYCPGDIMAVNPKWCLSLEEWKHNFHSWITNATPESILEINVFFDIHNAYGDLKLFNQLNNYIHEEAKKHPLFFQHYARNCLLYRPPLNMFGKIKTENNFISMKECLRPIELFGRIYALKNDIMAPSTPGRLRAMVEKKLITETSYREMIYVFDYLWEIQLKNQINQATELRKVGNKLNLSSLTDIEQQNLKNVLHKISTFQTMLSYDFFGTPNG